MTARGSVAAVLLAALAWSGTARAQEDVKARIAASARAAAASELASGSSSLARITNLYNIAGRLFGYEHVLLSAVAYSGRRCGESDSRSFWACDGDKKARSGIGALIGLPLLGGGAGHGAFDWWPRFETRSKEEVFVDFQQSAEGLSDLLAKHAKLDALDPEQRRQAMLTAARALKTMLDRQVSMYQDPDDASNGSVDDSAAWPRRLRQCVEALISKLVQLEAKTQPASELVVLRGTLGEAQDGAPVVALSAFTRPLDEAAAPTTAARALAASVSALPPTYDEVAAAAEELRGLVDAYRQLSHSANSVRGRHNYLLGPAVVIPIQDIAREWMYGLVLEAGGPRFRVTASGGFRTSYDNPTVVGPSGWYAGIGISGEFADDLFHWAKGAPSAANAVRTEIGAQR